MRYEQNNYRRGLVVARISFYVPIVTEIIVLCEASEHHMIQLFFPFLYMAYVLVNKGAALKRNAYSKIYSGN